MGAAAGGSGGLENMALDLDKLGRKHIGLSLEIKAKSVWEGETTVWEVFSGCDVQAQCPS